MTVYGSWTSSSPSARSTSCACMKVRTGTSTLSSLRNAHRLNIIFSRTVGFGSHSIPLKEAMIWNHFTNNLRCEKTLASLKKTTTNMGMPLCHLYQLFFSLTLFYLVLHCFTLFDLDSRCLTLSYLAFLLSRRPI